MEELADVSPILRLVPGLKRQPTWTTVMLLEKQMLKSDISSTTVTWVTILLEGDDRIPFASIAHP